MEKFIPYEKLSKKKRKELDAARRGSWNGVDPVSKRIESKKVYNRKRAQDWKKDHNSALVLFHFSVFRVKS